MPGWFPRSDGCLLAYAQAWDMSWFARADSRSRIGLISLEVSPRIAAKVTGGSWSLRSFAGPARTT